MADGPQIGQGHIEITPDVNKAATRKALKDLGAALQDVTGQFNKGQISALASSISAQRSLAEQHTRAMEASGKRQLDSMKRSISAQAALAAQRQKQLDIVAKAEIQAYAEKERRESAAHRAMLERQKAAAFSANAVGRVLNSVSTHLSQLSTRIGIASFQMEMLGGLMAATVTAPVLQGFGQLTQQGLMFATNIGYARASMQALLGPTADVEKIIANINRITVESPLFNTEDAVAYAQQLAAVNVSAKDLAPTMEAMGNIFLTQGVAGPERAKLAMLAYTQILSKGAIGMDDLRQQFAEHVPGGIKIFQEVARRLGFKTLDGLRDAMKNGKISAAQLNAEFIKLGNSPKYLLGAANAAKTLGGVWQSFKEEFQTQIGMAFDRNRDAIIKAIEDIRPVVASFVNWFVQQIPVVLMWLDRTTEKIRLIKQRWDELNPATKEFLKQLGLIVLAAGPASFAIGLIGTAMSTVVNIASALVKVLALAAGGGALGAAGPILLTIAGALGLLASAMVYLYNTSEPFRKKFLGVMNSLKDMFVKWVLPAVDSLWTELVKLGRLFESMGFKSEHLAYALWILAVPIAGLGVSLRVLSFIVTSVRSGITLLIGTVDFLVESIANSAFLVQKFAEVMAKIDPDSVEGKNWQKLADDIQGARKSMYGWIDTAKHLNSQNVEVASVTDDLAAKMNGVDFSTQGLIGGFTGLNGALDKTIEKEITLADAINNARSAMQSQNNMAASAKDASDSYSRSLLSLKDSIDANGRSLSDKTKKGLANRDALKQAAQASYEMMLQDIASGVPMQQAIDRHKARTEALKKEFGKNKETQAAAQDLINTYGKVPKDVQTLLKMMGYKDIRSKLIEILAAQKVAANPGMSFVKAKAAEDKAWRTEQEMNGLKGYATGGLARGPGGPTGDKIPAWLSDQEFVVRAASVKKFGVRALEYINQFGQLPPEYAKGGQATWPVNVDVSNTKFPPILGGSALGVGRMMAVLRAAFPGLALLSGFREGAITSTGNRSYHALGRAVDLPPRMDVFNWIAKNYGAGTKELIYTPAGSRQIKNGRRHTFTGGTIAQDHYDHVHWAYDNGGLIPPNQPFINKTGMSELALNSAQGAALEDRIRNSDRPVYVSVYVDGVRRDAEIVFGEKIDELVQGLGGTI